MFPKSLLVFLWAALASCAVLGSKSTQPNILFIFADDFGWNDVGYHGSEIRTPTLDRLAAEGVKLENYYVQSACTPSRSQLMTGRYQIRTGLQHAVIPPGRPFGLPLTETTLAAQLKRLGYVSHHVGKWHLGGHKWEYTATHRGFDTSYGFFLGNQDYYSHVLCRNISSVEYCGYDFWENEEPLWRAAGTYSAELFANRVEQLVKTHSEQNDERARNVHAPLQSPPRYGDQYDFITDDDRRVYAGMVSMLDETVDNVTRVFKEYGLWNNTLLVFSTDNGATGAGSNWPLLGIKGTLWEGGIRGVGFVSGPLLQTGAQQGSRCDELIHVSDWFPTLIRLARGSTSHLDLDGYDVWDTIRKRQASKRKEILHNIDPLMPMKGERLYTDSFDNRVHAAIRWRHWKLLCNPGPDVRHPPPGVGVVGVDVRSTVHDTSPDDSQNVWLFNLAEDPLEARDLSSRKPFLVRFLLDKLAAYNESAVPVMFPPFDPESNPAKHGGLWAPWID